MSDDDVKKELERLRNENAALKKGAATGITMKVSEKGGLSVYGMGRFPITLYKEQWLKLLDMSDAIRAFIAANEATLKVKGSGCSTQHVYRRRTRAVRLDFVPRRGPRRDDSNAAATSG